MPGIAYVEVGCADLDRSVRFYRDLLGLRLTDRTAASACVAADGWALQLVVAAPDPGPGGWRPDDLQRGLRHVGFKVGDVDAVAARLLASGVTFTVPPLDAVGGVRLAFFTDPDGTLLEILDGSLDYTTVLSPELAQREREAASARPRDSGPTPDHVAITVGNLDRSLSFYRDSLGFRPIGTLRHADDPRGFQITYLQAGSAVLEVFSFREGTRPGVDARTPGRTGLRAVGVGDADGLPARAAGGTHDGGILDPDGIALVAT